MILSKMLSSENEKKFVMRHSFENVMDFEEGFTENGPIETHFNIPWKIQISRCEGYLKVFLDCMVPSDNEDWSIHTNTAGKSIRKADEIKYFNCTFVYSKREPFAYFKSHPWAELSRFLNEGSYVVEFTVTIHDATGVSLYAPKSRVFDDELARENSDVTLIVKDQKFHVIKMYLAAHSTYFKALFFGNLSESGKSEIELKDINPHDFQMYLDLIYGETSVENYSVLEILHLADFFDSKTVVRRCEEFLMEKSNLALHEKFAAAIKYNLEALKSKCIAKMNSVADLRAVVPENSKDFDSEIWKELFLKSLSVSK